MLSPSPVQEFLLDEIGDGPGVVEPEDGNVDGDVRDRKSTRLNSSHLQT
jgi:hypothetical protein